MPYKNVHIYENVIYFLSSKSELQLQVITKYATIIN